MVVRFNIFPYSWSHCDERNEYGFKESVIRIYGWNEKNESTYVRVNDFLVPMWIELPAETEWTNERLRRVCTKLESLDTNKRPGQAPANMDVVWKHKLYFANVKTVVKDGVRSYEKKKFPFIQTLFHSTEAMKAFVWQINNRKLLINGLGSLTLKCHCYEDSITPVIKLLAAAELPSSNWIKGAGTRVKPEDKESTRMHEFTASWKTLYKHPEGDKLPIVHPKVMSFDLEMYTSSLSGGMPKANVPDDVILQFGCVVFQRNQPTKKYIFAIGQPKEIEGVTVVRCETESKMIIEWCKFIQEQDPDILLGYNIFGFDIPYIEARAKLYQIGNIYRIGCIRAKEAQFVNISWESTAFNKQNINYYDAEGRLWVDLLPYIKRNYKLSNYKLETVCDEFLKTNKDPIKPKDIVNSWRNRDWGLYTKVAAYCVQDCYVLQLLYDKLLIWFDLIETATTNGVPILYIYTQGQQIKMYSQVLRYCMHNDIIVQSKAMSFDSKDKFEGASVTEPKAGMYKMILPFDFASLYPSIIMAFNIDMSKYVTDDNIPDSDCHVFKWSSHKCCGCPKDSTPGVKPKKDKDGTSRVFCKDHFYRFLKADVSGKGVVPTLLESLIGARKTTRKQIEKNEEEIKRLRSVGDKDAANNLEEINQVLDKRQLSYKVSANSMYGAMGVKAGKLPFMPGAECVTFKGRESLMIASRYLEEKFGGTVIYNDTDSAYTYFDCLKDKTPEEIWAFANNVVHQMKYVDKLWPDPMKLEFEEKVYYKFLILSKKRYVGQVMKEDGSFAAKLRKSGVVLTRRDNCQRLRSMYEHTINFLLNHFEEVVQVNKCLPMREMLEKYDILKQLMCHLIDDMNRTFAMGYPFKEFVIVKGLTKEEYKGTPPPHVVVAQKQRRRGYVVEQDSRVEYLLLDTGDYFKKDVKQQNKVEALEWFIDYSEYLKLDYLYYLKSQFQKPIDQIFSVVFNMQFPFFERKKIKVLEQESNPLLQDVKKRKKYEVKTVWAKKSTKRNGVDTVTMKTFLEEQFEFRIMKQHYLWEIKELFRRPIRFQEINIV